MQVSEIAGRYAKALFDLATENKTQDRVFNDLRALEVVFSNDRDIKLFLESPLLQPSDRLKVLKASLDGKGLSKEVYDLILLLAAKSRLAVFPRARTCVRNRK